MQKINSTKYLLILLLITCLIISATNDIYATKTKKQEINFDQETYIVEDRSRFQKLDEPTVAVALGGGGGRALVHIGVLKALEEAEIPIDMVVGTSMGAIVGSMYGSGIPINKIEEVATKSSFSQLFELNLFSNQSLLKTKKLNLFLEDLTPQNRLENFWLPTAFLSCDLNSGHKYIHTTGLISNKIKHAYAIPFYFPVQQGGEHTLVDPGIVESVPAKTAKVLGADIVISSQADGKLKINQKYSTNAQNIQRMIELIQDRLSGPIIEQYSDFVIDNPVSQYSFIDFNQADKLIQIGYQYTKEQLPALKEVLQKNNVKLEPTTRNSTVNIDDELINLKYDRLVMEEPVLTPQLYFGKDHSHFKQSLFRDDLYQLQYGLKWQNDQLTLNLLNTRQDSQPIEGQLRIKQLTPNFDLISKTRVDNSDNWELSLKYHQKHYTFKLGQRVIEGEEFGLVGNQYHYDGNNLSLTGESSLLINSNLTEYQLLTSQQAEIKLNNIWSLRSKLVYNNTDLLDSPKIYRGQEPNDQAEFQTAVNWIYTHNFLPTVKLKSILQLTNIQYYLFTDYLNNDNYSSSAVGIGADMKLNLLGLKPLDFGIYLANDNKSGSEIGCNINLTF
ncbi:MAG: patatin-like phospholipase family protein [Bacillota bacterium]